MSLETHDVTWSADGVPIVGGVTIGVPEGRFTDRVPPSLHVPAPAFRKSRSCR